MDAKLHTNNSYINDFRLLICQNWSVDGNLPVNTRWKRNASRLAYQCCISYFFEDIGDIMNCGIYRDVKLLKHARKIVGDVLEND